MHNKTNELEIEERALVEKVNEEKKLRREKKDDGSKNILSLYKKSMCSYCNVIK